jgi:two-component system sensor histidine kinase BarA
MMKKILAVDDDPINRQLMQIFLSDDFECKVVNSAQQALDALNSQPFDLVVTDINLGSAQDGIWLGKYIKQSAQFTHIPVVAITAHVMSYTGKDEIKEAFDTLVQKPIIKQRLIEQLKQILGI